MSGKRLWLPITLADVAYEILDALYSQASGYSRHPQVYDTDAIVKQQMPGLQAGSAQATRQASALGPQHFVDKLVPAAMAIVVKSLVQSGQAQHY